MQAAHWKSIIKWSDPVNKAWLLLLLLLQSQIKDIQIFLETCGISEKAFGSHHTDCVYYFYRDLDSLWCRLYVDCGDYTCGIFLLSVGLHQFTNDKVLHAHPSSEIRMNSWHQQLIGVLWWLWACERCSAFLISILALAKDLIREG